MKKRESNGAEAPALIQKVTRRKPIEAERGFPRDAAVELFRSWAPSASAKITVAGKKRGPTIVSGPPPGTIFNPPNIPAERVERAHLRGLDLEPQAGSRPLHLPLHYKPARTTRIKPRTIREGRDIPNSVFTPDSRLEFQDTAYPWCTVGRVETPLGFATGTMVGPRHLLTCSHAIQWNADGTAGWVKFTPSYYDGQAPFGSAWAERTFSWKKVDGSGGISDADTAFDYVVLVLDSRLGDTVGWAGSRTYDSAWNDGAYWQQLGYPGDLTSGQRPVFTTNGAISSSADHSTSGQTGRVLGNFIDTSGGHSGGPYWGWWGTEVYPSVIGTDSTSPRTPGNDTSGDNEAGGGPALVSLISYAIQQHP